jgi:diaminohydroxyphosphoribosylaminopyrimidine deaminase / 5-amino-6-(5-phosphoribosylamino)uracil reductase
MHRTHSAQSAEPNGDSTTDAARGGWAEVPTLFRKAGAVLSQPWKDLFDPLRAGAVDDLMVIGQIGQSVDGRIATESGHSHYVNGDAGLAHLHRLRAVVDAVVIGVGSVIKDDPRLTVRRVAGPDPARVVIDPNGRLPRDARLLADGAPRLIVTARRGDPASVAGAETLALPASDGEIPPAVILAALAERGFRRILVEGGANTLSRFLAAGCLDRLHIMVAPVILGSGYPSLKLPPIVHMGEALRPPMRAHVIGDEVLWDCDLTAQRVPVGHAKKST